MAQAQETGAGLGAPPVPGEDRPGQNGEVPTEDAEGSVDPAVVAPTTQPAPNTEATPPSNQDIPPPPQGNYTVPSGYGNHPPPRFVPTQPTFQASLPRRRIRVRVREGTQIPEDANVFERRSKVLLLPGAIAFAVSYAISIGAGVTDDDRVFFAPFVGPLIWQLDEGTSDTAGFTALLTIAQTAGAFLFALGMRKKKYAEWYAGDRRISLAAAPTRGGAALSLNVW